MESLDRLLANARLVPTAPYTQADIDAAEARIVARLEQTVTAWRDGTGSSVPEPDRSAGSAALDLNALCETVLTQRDGVDHLQQFVARCLPEPDAARILGCILNLASCPDSARFWWQYAAGAGDQPATYCLALYHRAHGEDHEADWWHTQMDLPTSDADSDEQQPASTATVLRVLRILRHGRPPSKLATTLISYVPAAVGFVDDDLELPLPDPDFTDRLGTLVAPPPDPEPDRRQRSVKPLPEREPLRWVDAFASRQPAGAAWQLELTRRRLSSA
jgi:hypothetical protein